MNKPFCFSFLRIVVLLCVFMGVYSCCKNKKGNEVPDPLAEKKEAQEKYEAAITLIESGTDTNYSQALGLLEEAAKQGNDSAQVAVGAMFEYGKGTSSDMTKARQYYEQAAAQGNQEAKEKIHILDISKSKLDLPSGFSTPMNEIMVWNADTLRVLNGDASFFSSEKNVMVVDKNMNPIYVSFRALEGKSATEPIQLDAQETAVSLLLLAIPYGLTMENDHYQTLLRELLNGMPETSALAKAIEASVARSGHFVYDEVKNEMDAAIRQIKKKLNLDTTTLPEGSPSQKASAYGPSSFSLPRQGGESSAASGNAGLRSVGTPKIAWGESYYYDELKTRVDGDYRNGSGGHREWKLTVSNEMPMYFYLEHGYMDEMEMSGDELKKWRESQGLSNDFIVDNMIKPSNLSKFFDMAGVNGVDALCDAYKTLYDEASTIVASWLVGEKLDSFDKKWGKQIVSTWIPIESDRDVLFICSQDRHPEMILVGVFDLMVVPVLAQCLSKYVSDQTGGFNGIVYSTLLDAFITSVDSELLLRMNDAIKNNQLGVFAGLLIDHLEKWIPTGFNEVLAKLFKDDLIKESTYKSLVANGCLFPDLMSEGMTEAILKEITAVFTAAKWLEIIVNSFAWTVFQFSMGSYSVGFTISADGVPEKLEPVDMGVSVKWANCNVGATSPWGGGRLYAWGETYDKVSYEWDSYRFGQSSSSLTKYNQSDGITALEPEDDAATKMWGEKWRTPTAEEFRELMDNCTFEVGEWWGQRGYILTSKKTGKYIFLPSAGSSVSVPVLDGRYWTASLDPGNLAYAQTFEFNTGSKSGSYSLSQFRRSGGMSVRGVQDLDNPKLKVSRTSLVFDDTPVGQTAEMDWTITNVGNASMTVYGITVPDGFSTDFSSWVAKKLDPNESQVIKVYFTPTETKTYSGKLVFKSNAVNAQEQGFTIGGKGVSPSEARIKVSKTFLDFGDVTVGQSSTLDWAITNIGDATLKVSSLTVPGGFSTDFSSWSSKSLAPNESHTFKVTFKPTEAKQYSGKMVFKSNAVNAKEQGFTIGGKGVAAGEAKISVSPNTVQFGEKTVGNTAEQTVTITNKGDAPLVFTSVTSPDNVFSTDFGSWTSKTLAAGASCSLKVYFTPAAVRSYSTSISIKTNASNAPDVALPVSGAGISAAGEANISLSTSSLQFVDVALGQTKEQSVRITNNGNATLDIMSVTSSDELFSTDFDNWSKKSLAAGASCTLKVSFKPRSIGRYFSSTITIKSNASNNPSLYLVATGNCIHGSNYTYKGDYVDMGLSVMWATCNLGASSPEEYGAYFAWGETEPKEEYEWYTYKWCKGTENTITKYCPDGSYGYNGYVDNKTVLDLEDDAAYKKLGSKYRIPNCDDWTELFENSNIEWTNNYKGSGIPGIILTSKIKGYTNKSIFLPAAGYDWGYQERVGRYGTTEITSHKYGIRLCVYFEMSTNNVWYKRNQASSDRPAGDTIRPIRIRE